MRVRVRVKVRVSARSELLTKCVFQPVWTMAALRLYLLTVAVWSQNTPFISKPTTY